LYLLGLRHFSGTFGVLKANRYFSTALDEDRLWTAIRYVECNPVLAGLVERAEQWAWSSAGAHVRGETVAPLDPRRPFLEGPRDASTGRKLAWRDWLAQGVAEEDAQAIRRATQTGRPLGDEGFVAALEARSGRTLRTRKRGSKPKKNSETDKTEDMFPGT
jgi:putative transposase